VPEKAKRHHKAGLGQWDLVRSIQFQPQPACGLLTFQKQITCISRALGAAREVVVFVVICDGRGGIRRPSICADAA
jgi:hypothetical protein